MNALCLLVNRMIACAIFKQLSELGFICPGLFTSPIWDKVLCFYVEVVFIHGSFICWEKQLLLRIICFAPHQTLNHIFVHMNTQSGLLNQYISVAVKMRITCSNVCTTGLFISVAFHYFYERICGHLFAIDFFTHNHWSADIPWNIETTKQN